MNTNANTLKINNYSSAIWRDGESKEGFEGVAGLKTKYPLINKNPFLSYKILNEGLAFLTAEIKFTGK